MCGICGIYGLNISSNELKLFHQLLFINQLRGAESTGVLRIDKDKKKTPKILKMVAPSSHYLMTKTGKDFVDPTGQIPYMFLGHCRSSTRGEITHENAHPFVFHNVIGVHNGTLHYTADFDGWNEFGTDSEALYFNIDKKGIQKALEDCVSYDGAYALAYVDRKTHRLCFIRNGKRPLHFTFIAGGTTMLWSSSQSHLKMVVDDSVYTPEGLTKDWPNKGDTTVAPIFTLNENDMLSVEIGKPARSAIIEHIDVKKRTTTYTSHTYYSGHYETGVWEEWTSESEKAKSGHENFPQARDMVEGPDGIWRSKEEDKRYKEYLARRNAEEKKQLEPYQRHLQDALDGVEPEDDDGELADIPWLNGRGKKKKAAEPKNSLPPAKVSRSRKTLSVPQSRKELLFKLSKGCGCCSQPFDASDSTVVDNIHWLTRDIPICDSCYQSESWIRSQFSEDWTEFENLPPSNTTMMQ